MKIPRYIVIKLEMIGKDTIKATEITDRCEVYEYEADENEPQTGECQFDDAIPCEWVCTEYGKCKYKPKTEPQTDIHDLTDCDFCKDRNCKDCEGGKDEPQTEKPKIRKRNDKPFRAVWLDDDHNEIGTTQTDCSWR